MALWPYLLTACFAMVVMGYFLWHYRRTAKRAIGFCNEMRQKSATELELSLATWDQLLGELKNRPNRFVLMTPEFKTDDKAKTFCLAHVSLDAVNVPVEVAIDVLRLSAKKLEDEAAQEGSIPPPYDPWKSSQEKEKDE